MTGEGKRTIISLSKATKDTLNSIKHPGQSYTGLIQELVSFWKKEHGIEELREAAGDKDHA